MRLFWVPTIVWRDSGFSAGSRVRGVRGVLGGTVAIVGAEGAGTARHPAYAVLKRAARAFFLASSSADGAAAAAGLGAGVTSLASRLPSTDFLAGAVLVGASTTPNRSARFFFASSSSAAFTMSGLASPNRSARAFALSTSTSPPAWAGVAVAVAVAVTSVPNRSALFFFRSSSSSVVRAGGPASAVGSAKETLGPFLAASTISSQSAMRVDVFRTRPPSTAATSTLSLDMVLAMQ
mmetsp:Transcript_79839/g.140904  ORF Transcript_79839/g.140904 Transcript_79839/m.140904 type:complete len:236 (-) Transcript_79839:14-721(-)